jgi:hypothetical protein
MISFVSTVLRDESLFQFPMWLKVWNLSSGNQEKFSVVRKGARIGPDREKFETQWSKVRSLLALAEDTMA